jgi:hypothetical protein
MYDLLLTPCHVWTPCSCSPLFFQNWWPKSSIRRHQGLAWENTWVHECDSLQGPWDFW